MSDDREPTYLVPEPGYECFFTADEIRALMDLIDNARDSEPDTVTGTPLETAYLILDNHLLPMVPKEWQDVADGLKDEQRRFDVESGNAISLDDLMGGDER